MTDSVNRISNLTLEEKQQLLKQVLRKKAEQIVVESPLSWTQLRGWFYRVRTGKPYTFVLILNIVSSLNIPAVKRVFQKLVNRHQMLRTTFSVREENILLKIHGYQEACFEERDASNWSQEELRKQVIKAYQRPFDLEHGPLMRVTLFRQASDKYRLLIAVDHIVCDVWTSLILLEELKELYSAEIAGKNLSLPSLPWQYTDYIRWHYDMLHAEEGERLLDYWQKQLPDQLPVLDLPTDHQRPPSQKYQRASYSFRVTAQLLQSLKELARNEGGTLYMILLAAFHILLYRYTRQDDILLGTVTTGRSRPEFIGIAGDFINPVVMYAHFSDNPSFKTFFQYIRQKILGAFEHQDYPLPLLVEHLKLKRAPDRSLLFQVLFTFHQMQRSKELLLVMEENDQKRTINWGGIEIAELKMTLYGSEEDQNDLTLDMVELPDSLYGEFRYDTALFEETTLERMTNHFQTLLEGIVAHPDQQVSDLPLLTQHEQQQLLVTWNNTQKAYPLDTCLHHLIETQVERTPEAIAVVFPSFESEGEDIYLTYRELNERANQLAWYLRSLGVGPEVLVGICVERSIEMIVGLLGIIKAGGAYVPLDPEYPEERLTFMLDDSRVSVLLTQEKLLDTFPGHQARMLCLDRDWQNIAQERTDNPDSQVSADNLIYVIYTSGSTGRPKGSRNIHRALCNRLCWMQDAYQLTENDRVLQKTPFSFDVSGWEFYWPLLTGACLVFAKPGGHKDSTYLRKLIAKQHITTVHFVPSMLQMFLEEPDLETCTRLKRVMCSGEALSYDVQQRFFARFDSVELHNLYGPTEAAIDVTSWACTPHGQDMNVPIGYPIANTEMYILDARYQPTPIGISGELYIGGVNLARDYLNRPDLTAEKFIPHPFSNKPGARLYRTGDVACYLPNGSINYLGRLDHQVKLRGFRIELGEIEHVLVGHTAVKEALVIAREEQSGDKRLVAYIVPVQAQPPKSNELRHFLKEYLPEYMIPSTFVMLEALPLTPNGKLDRRSLPLPDALQRHSEEKVVEPHTPIEHELAQIWKDTLQTEHISIHDNFFEIGGHSLIAIRVMTKIQQHFNTEFPLTSLLQYPTIAELANFIEQAVFSDTTFNPLIPLQPLGDISPFFCVHPIEGTVFCYHELARQLGTKRPFYGLQAFGLDPMTSPLDSLEEMGRVYIEHIRAIQPHGPYLLGGFSFGGIVAYEISQQLQHSGERTELLVLLDTLAPHLYRIMSDETQRFVVFLYNVGGLFGVDLSQVYGKIRGITVEEGAMKLYNDLQGLSFQERLQTIWECVEKAHILPPGFDSEYFRRIFTVFNMNIDAVLSYHPRSYTAPVVLFRALNGVREQINSEDRLLGWRKYVSSFQHVYDIPGEHYSILRQPYINMLTEKLLCVFAEKSNFLEISA